MFVVTGGMQKSGSTLLHVYALHLLSEQYGPESQTAFEHWIQHGPVGGSGSFPWGGWTEYIGELVTLAETSGSFVLKTHAAFTDLNASLSGRDINVVYSFRDPRGAVLSALDHGARSRANNDWPYVECVDIKTTLPLVRDWCKAAVTWLDAPGVELFRYEELIASREAEVTRLARHLGIPSPGKAARSAIDREQAERAPGKNQFNRGVVTRWPDEMSTEDVRRCEEELGPYIVQMGYKLKQEQAH